MFRVNSDQYQKLRILIAAVVIALASLEFLPREEQSVRELKGRVTSVQLSGAGDIIAVSLDTGNTVKFSYVRWDTSPLAELKRNDEIEVAVVGNYEVQHEVWGTSARKGDTILYSKAIQERHKFLERIAAVLVIISGMSYIFYVGMKHRMRGAGASAL